MNLTDYVWDTQEHLATAKPYGFIDFKEGFFDIYLKKRNNSKNLLKKSFSNILSKEDLVNSKIYSQEELLELKEFDSNKMINTIYQKLQSNQNLDYVLLNHFKRILKKADLRKLRESYDRNFTNTSKEDAKLETHALLALSLGEYSKKRKEGYLQFLSTMLKENDYLISKFGKLNTLEGISATYYSLDLEVCLVNEVKTYLNELKKNKSKIAEICIRKVPVKIKNLGMLLQEGNRSKAYLQALTKAGLNPNFSFLLKSEKLSKNLDEVPKKRIKFLFDPLIPEEKTLEEKNIEYQIIQANSCNNAEVVEALKKRPEEFFVFSGWGILNEILDAGKKIVHIHPGKLPEYRGSTCHFYSTLMEGKWYCTSFLMEKEIDKGETILQREFSLPGKNIDDARIYDPYTRALTLVDVVNQLSETGTLKTNKQDLIKGIDYYIIHPVLGFIRRDYLDTLD